MVVRQSIKKEIFLVFFLVFLGAFFVYVYKSAMLSQKEIFQHIQKNKINEYSQIFDNFTKCLANSHAIATKKELFNFLKNKKERQKHEKILSLLNTDEVKYIYILQKDDKGRFRFLLDASKEDKAHFYQKFDVSNKKYIELYKTKHPQIIDQTNIKNLYLTYLYPIIVNNNIIAIASVDISTKFKSDIAESMDSFKILFRYLIFLIFLVIAIMSIYIFYYYLSRKKLFTDPLTKVFNRNYMQEIKSSLNLNNYAIAMVDLDRFKTVNDTYGHKAGDYVLAQCAKIIKDSLRDNDILIRFGGEEFLILLYVRGNTKSAISISKRVKENIAKFKFVFETQEILMSASIGLNIHPSESKHLDEAIKIADKKLYIAKQNGRNQVVSSLSERSQILENNQIKDIDFVKRAIDENRVVCYFQPIYDVKTNTIIKYEALVRIIDIDGTVISPFFFLPYIQYTNIHFKLTKRIFNICFEAVKTIQNYISININYSDLINEDIEKFIVNNLKDNHKLASRITFEILETDEITNIELFIQKIDILHSMGCSISIDDFGSGYSNFKTVLDMEADYLKIDGTLVKNIDKDEKSYRVVKNIIQFAKDSSMKTIAEFVHSKEVYDKLLELDVDYVQGFYISEPKPITSLAL